MSQKEELFQRLDVSRETWTRLEAYAELLERWTGRINLISRGSVSEIWERHIADSCQLIDFITPEIKSWLDLGSGGGLPGIIVAILARERAPDMTVSLVESDQRKSTFLRTAIRELELNADVESSRIEAMPPQHADIISARALARLPVLLDYVELHGNGSGKSLFLKGTSFEKEVVESRETWHFDLQVRPSLTDPQAALLVIGELSRV